LSDAEKAKLLKMERKEFPYKKVYSLKTDSGEAVQIVIDHWQNGSPGEIRSRDPQGLKANKKDPAKTHTGKYTITDLNQRRISLVIYTKNGKANGVEMDLDLKADKGKLVQRTYKLRATDGTLIVIDHEIDAR